VWDLLVFALAAFEDRKVLHKYSRKDFWESQFDLAKEEGIKAMSEMILRPVQKVRSTATIDALLRVFDGNAGLHRVCVMDNDTDVIAIVSQTDLVRFLKDRADALPESFCNATVGQWALRDIVTASPNEEVSKAFERMVDADTT
jgi:CBS domain-containing protein